MSDETQQTTGSRVGRHRFPVLDGSNGEAYRELVVAMIQLRRDLTKLNYPFRQGGAIECLRSNRIGSSWEGLPLVFYMHAFSNLNRISPPPEQWVATRMRDIEKLGINRLFHRISDGTIMTIDLGKTQHWFGRFDQMGAPLGDFASVKATAVRDNLGWFARWVFNSCDVLVMEDFRVTINSPEALSSPQSAWLDRINCRDLYLALLREAKETRRRLVLVNSDWTSWTCPTCHGVHKDHERSQIVRTWTCPTCTRTVHRDKASCLELLRRFRASESITFDLAKHGPAFLWNSLR